jgi:PhzF family phenazine biosynthesis protein
MKFPLFWIDAFTDKVFGGNPAAIIPLERWLDTALLQRIAFQNGLSETAYFVRTGPQTAQLRWFTPLVEVDLCGHATLATAFVLYNVLGQTGDLVSFETKSGTLTVARKGELLQLNFPAQPAEAAEPTLALLNALGKRPAYCAKANGRWLCVYVSENAVASLAPTMDLLMPVLPGRIIVSGPGTDCDFVSRFFAPDAGILEDPVTGSAHCTLVPYWATKLGKTALHARQISQRGGELWCELSGDRVLMSGKGALYLKGEIDV